MPPMKLFELFAYHVLTLLLLSLSCQWTIAAQDEDVGEPVEFESMKSNLKVAEAKPPRYLLYDVNRGEGFNLRRDVYMRIAVLVHELNKKDPWILVLPPWSNLYHWKSQDIGRQERIPWSKFFDMPSLKEFVPVMEFDEFLKVRGEPVIDEIYYLQRYAEGWDKWEEKIDIRPCIDNPYHYDPDTDRWYGWFFGYDENVWAKKLECLSAMAHAGFIKDFLNKNTTGRSIMLDRGEVLLHDHFGNAMFWKARRSMRFAKHLREIADEFRKEHLDSNDEDDMTVLDPDWQKMKRKHGEALGGPYMAAHLRRQDFVFVRKSHTPSLEYAAKQIKEAMEKTGLKKIFIATDAPDKEFKELSKSKSLKGYEIYRFSPSREIRKKYKDGGVAIIDQWIATHARYFIGTSESTFSFRIRDEREILGFDPSTTYNQFCVQGEECEEPSKWQIVY